MKSRLVQLICALVLIICCIGLGLELFANDMENLLMIRIFAYTALTALFVNTGAAIYRATQAYCRKDKGEDS